MRTHGIGDGGDEGEVVTCPLRVVAWPAVGVPTNGTLWAGDLVRTAGIMGYPITGPTSNTSHDMWVILGPVLCLAAGLMVGGS